MPDSSPNPFDPTSADALPFAEREAAFARLHQHLIDPQPTQALVLLGAPGGGKSALLYHLPARYTDEVFSFVLLSLRPELLTDETVFLRGMYQALVDTLLTAGIAEEKLPALPLRRDNWRVWLAEFALTRLLATLRSGRRLVLLLDDADQLISALASGRLAADLPIFLQSLLRPQLGMVLTVNASLEDQLSALVPLVNPAQAFRLRPLTTAELIPLFTGPDADHTHAVSDAVQRATGGKPLLVQRFGYYLWERTGSRSMTLDDVTAVTPRLYADADGVYHDAWRGLTLNERLVLTALVSLLYDQPLLPVTAEQVAAWLTQTDFKMDVTAVHAAVRSLEYHELLVNARGNLSPQSALLQRWLLENARLDGLTDAPRPSPPTSPAVPRPLWVLTIAVGIVFIILVLLRIL
ncbi:MAG: hypothetical protein H7Y11_15335, partial [Armatimonadetes bacterium]|nr:hypothetical protein [Anaerolineae bacterium]